MKKISFLRKIVMFSSLTLLLCALFVRVQADTGDFLRDMHLGDRGDDVRTLQKILNSDPRTTIAVSGAGSPGFETDYFGIKTKNAVMKFQALYLPEILGVSSDSIAPTGFVGPLTRKKLNLLGLNQTSSQGITDTLGSHSIPVPVATSSYNPDLTDSQKKNLAFFMQIFQKTKPTLFNMTRFEASPGMEVVANGEGFLQEGNMVHFGDSYSVSSTASKDGKSVVFTVPQSIVLGKYNVWISNKNGDTKSFSKDDFFLVTTTPRDPPVITSVFPTTLSTSDKNLEITITGKNFDTTSNSIYSSLGNITGVSSDGNTIRVKVSDFPNYKDIAPKDGKKMGYSFPVTVYVLSGTRATVTAGTFTLEF